MSFHLFHRRPFLDADGDAQRPPPGSPIRPRPAGSLPDRALLFWRERRSDWSVGPSASPRFPTSPRLPRGVSEFGLLSCSHRFTRVRCGACTLEDGGGESANGSRTVYEGEGELAHSCNQRHAATDRGFLKVDLEDGPNPHAQDFTPGEN